MSIVTRWASLLVLTVATLSPTAPAANGEAAVSKIPSESAAQLDAANLGEPRARGATAAVKGRLAEPISPKTALECTGEDCASGTTPSELGGPELAEVGELALPEDVEVDTKGLPTGEAKSGVTSQSISTPSGEGSVNGMDESFSAQLSTGVATFAVPFSLLKARGAAQPSLALSYTSSGGFDIAGTGWSVGVPFIARQTDRGIPRYNDRSTFHPGQDRFVYNGGQELVPICDVSAHGSCKERGDEPVVLPDGEVMPDWAVDWMYFRPRIEGAFMRFFWS